MHMNISLYTVCGVYVICGVCIHVVYMVCVCMFVVSMYVVYVVYVCCVSSGFAVLPWLAHVCHSNED